MQTGIKKGPRRRALAIPTALVAGLVAALGWLGAHADEGLASPALQDALNAASTISGARIDVVALDRPAGDCVTTRADGRAEVSRPIDGSGRVAVKLIGSRARSGACEVWAWARVRVFAQVPVAARSIRAGETLGAGAVHNDEREIKPGHVPAVLMQGSVADHSLGAGQMIERGAVRAPGLPAGASVKVLILSGALAIEETGRVVPCGRDSVCAALPSGKHVEGVFADGRLTVQLP